MLERLRFFLRSRTEGEVKRLARATEEWLKDETLNVGLAALRQAIIERWLKSQTTEEREKCWFEVQRMNAFVKQLRIIVEHDKADTIRQEQQEKRAKSAGPEQAE